MIHATNRVQISTQADWLESYVPTVLRALNEDRPQLPRTHRRRAIVLLIKRIQRAEAAATNIRFDVKKFRVGQIATLVPTPEWTRQQEKLDRFLMRYHASPRMNLHPVLKPGVQDGTLYWGLTWVTAREGKKWFRDEMLYLDAVFQIARNGGINALRQCDHCQRWIFARRPGKDRFCSPECRELFHRTNEADKARRRNWARENYQTRKTLEAGSSKAANQREIRNTGRKSK